MAPSNVYPTKDGTYILIAANQDSVFRRLSAAMGRPELADDPRYSSHAARGETQTELDELISEWTATKDAAELEALMDESGVPSGKIYRAPEMLEDAHFKARDAIVSVMHPKFGDLKMQNVAPKLSLTPGTIRAPAPEIGQHNDEIYGGLLDFDAERLAGLKERGII